MWRQHLGNKSRARSGGGNGGSHHRTSVSSDLQWQQLDTAPKLQLIDRAEKCQWSQAADWWWRPWLPPAQDWCAQHSAASNPAPSNPPSTQSFRLRCLYFVMLGVRTHDIISQNGVLQQIIGSNVGSGAAVMSHTYLYMIYTLLNAHNYTICLKYFSHMFQILSQMRHV